MCSNSSGWRNAVNSSNVSSMSSSTSASSNLTLSLFTYLAEGSLIYTGWIWLHFGYSFCTIKLKTSVEINAIFKYRITIFNYNMSWLDVGIFVIIIVIIVVIAIFIVHLSEILLPKRVDNIFLPRHDSILISIFIGQGLGNIVVGIMAYNAWSEAKQFYSLLQSILS